MATIALNIYDKSDKTKVVKVLKTEGYDLMLGTVEDFMAIIDVDKLGDNAEIAKMVIKGYGQVKPLLMDIFPDLSDDDFRNVKVNELVITMTQIGHAVVESLSVLKTSKN